MNIYRIILSTGVQVDLSANTFSWAVDLLMLKGDNDEVVAWFLRPQGIWKVPEVEDV